MVVTAAIDGLTSNLALTVPLGLTVFVGSIGPTLEHWLIPTRRKGERSPEDRERARRRRERVRAARREALSAHKEKGS